MTEEMYFVRDKSLSKVTPKFQTEEDGDKVLSLKVTDNDVTSVLCCLDPTRRYSVLEGLIINQFVISLECTVSNVDDR